MNCKNFLRKLLRIIFQERSYVTMNETLIKLLQKNRTNTVGEKKEEEKRYCQVLLSMKK